jgi:hypothetical protein
MANYLEEMGLAWVLALEPTSDARSFAPDQWRTWRDRE